MARPSGGWPAGPGVVTFPDGTTVRGRGMRRPAPAGPAPQWRLALGHRDGDRVLAWRDFWLPADPADARAAFGQALALARDGMRVEVACGGGRGRTGTALACMAVLSGVPAGEAVRWVRERYDRGAVETPWQRRVVRRFG